MTPRQIFWHNLKADVAALGIGHCVERDDPHPFRLAGEVRSQVGGPWRAYLPGSTYHVRAVDTKVRITRVA